MFNEVKSAEHTEMRDKPQGGGKGGRGLESKGGMAVNTMEFSMFP